jgi:hypothetical protein
VADPLPAAICPPPNVHKPTLRGHRECGATPCIMAPKARLGPRTWHRFATSAPALRRLNWMVDGQSL